MGDICYVCGKEVEIPYRCSYCNLTFCDEHRLPEEHNCTMLPERDWDTYRNLKNSREGYGWPFKPKTTNQLPNKSTPKPIEYSSSIERKNNKKIYLWLSILSIIVIGLALYSTGYYEIIGGWFNSVGTEDFSIFKVSDPANRYTIEESTAIFNSMNRLDKNEYMYKVFTETSITAEFDLIFNHIDTNPEQRWRVCLISLSSGLGDYITQCQNGETQIVVSVGSRISDKFYLIIVEALNMQTSSGIVSNMDFDVNSKYHIVFERNNMNVQLTILKDSEVIEEIDYILKFENNPNYLLLLQSTGHPNGNLKSSGRI